MSFQVEQRVILAGWGLLGLPLAGWVSRHLRCSSWTEEEPVLSQPARWVRGRPHNPPSAKLNPVKKEASWQAQPPFEGKVVIF